MSLARWRTWFSCLGVVHRCTDCGPAKYVRVTLNGVNPTPFETEELLTLVETLLQFFKACDDCGFFTQGLDAWVCAVALEDVCPQLSKFSKS